MSFFTTYAVKNKHNYHILFILQLTNSICFGKTELKRYMQRMQGMQVSITINLSWLGL